MNIWGASSTIIQPFCAFMFPAWYVPCISGYAGHAFSRQSCYCSPGDILERLTQHSLTPGLMEDTTHHCNVGIRTQRIFHARALKLWAPSLPPFLLKQKLQCLSWNYLFSYIETLNLVSSCSVFSCKILMPSFAECHYSMAMKYNRKETKQKPSLW